MKRAVLVLFAVLVVALPAVAAEQRGIFRFDIDAYDRSFREAISENSSELKYLAVSGRRGIEKAVEAYGSCVDKKGEAKCSEKRAAFVAALGLYVDRMLGVVQNVESKLDLPPEVRYELGRLLLPGPDGQLPKDRTLESLRLLIPPETATASGGATNTTPHLALRMIQHFSQLTQDVFQAPGGQVEVLARQVRRLEEFRLYALSFRRFIVLYADSDSREHFLAGFGDAVEGMIEAKGDPLGNLPTLTPGGQDHDRILLEALPRLSKEKK